MRDLNGIKISPIKDSKLFERLCRDLWKNDSSNINVDLYGSFGQEQDGVDVFGRKKNTNKWFGIQCKVRESKLTKLDITNEILKAEKFNPKLEEYIICTTIKKDKKLQDTINEFNNDGYKFNIKLLFWDDIEELLKEENNFNIFYRYYEEFIVDNQTLGHAIGKLINLELGVDKFLDTHYDIMIGKIPKFKKEKKSSIDYYQNTYFIINFHEKKMETFPLPCFSSDIEQAFSFPFDRDRIAIWINSINDLDKFIYSKEDRVETYITREEYTKKFGVRNEEI